VFFDIGLTLDSYFRQATQDLRHALEMLFQANAELRQFAQLTSHDLKTPLATVANLCDEVLDEFGDGLPAEARQLIEAARNRTLRMGTTIDELLSTSVALQPGRPAESVSSRDVIADVVEQLRPQMHEKNIEVVIAPDLPNVVGERVRIREAFFNLLSNAAKFMDKPQGRIAIDVEVNNGDCIFSIADNGPGIPKEDLGRLFAPFTRLAKHHHIPGSGLGLYFTRQMIEQQGGRVWVESEPGRGSRFFVLLKRS
jgi:signal transduction histidine kinase